MEMKIDMKFKHNGTRIAGISLILSGVLFLAQSLFLLPVPRPPLADADLLSWLAEWKLHLAMADELLFFATLCLIVALLWSASAILLCFVDRNNRNEPFVQVAA